MVGDGAGAAALGTHDRVAEASSARSDDLLRGSARPQVRVLLDNSTGAFQWLTVISGWAPLARCRIPAGQRYALTRAVIPTFEVGLHCGTAQRRQDARDTWVIPTSEVGLHCGAQNGTIGKLAGTCHPDVRLWLHCGADASTNAPTALRVRRPGMAMPTAAVAGKKALATADAVPVGHEGVISHQLHVTADVVGWSPAAVRPQLQPHRSKPRSSPKTVESLVCQALSLCRSASDHGDDLLYSNNCSSIGRW